MTPPTQKRDASLPAGLIERATAKTSARLPAQGRKGHSYKPLPTRFRHSGFEYRQIARQGEAAIYEQTWKGNETSAAFEVIRIRRREGFQIGGRLVEPAEVYPNSKSWGVDGFTATSKAAFAKLWELA